ncbi:MAG: hypothetical protein HFF22_08565 [Oscillospiraceae bacterium]|jgi:hypothetical protein|nr:hypothetical protein [Oscillospiraceae bacterium]
MRQTIYLTQHSLWQNQAAGQRLEQASGGDSAAPCWWEAPSAPAGRVVDLAAWKAENLMELDRAGEETPEPESGLAAYGGRELRRRPREKHRAALALGELAATLSVAGLALALILRVLLF